VTSAGGRRLLDLILDYDCNLACDYCTISPEMRTRSLASADAIAAMQRARADGITRVSFTGGEPTIRPDLLALVRRAKQLGFTEIKLQTNGLLLGAGNNLARLLEAGVGQIHISIHTHEPEAYESLVGRRGTHGALVAGLSAVVAAGVPAVADVILQRSTHARLPAAVRWLHGLGFVAADLWFVSLTDHNRDNVASMPRMTEVMPSIDAAIAIAEPLGMRIRSLHIPRCILGALHGHAWDPAADGVRVVSPDATFDLRDSRLTPDTRVAACTGCAFEGRCPGIRADYLARWGDAEFAAARGLAPRRVLPRA
jgi:molybdenum cofactor biosynthesis enzyme MoaA